MALPLSRSYDCIHGAPTIDRVDPRIFTLTYFAKCMDCTFCHDACCQYGADIDIVRVQAMEKHQEGLEQYLGIPRERWFREDSEDVGWLDEKEYPGGKYTRTEIVELPEGRMEVNEYACVFLDPKGRGCLLHRYALEKGVDVHEIKPMVCLMFPVLFDGGCLVPAREFDIEDELVCLGPGETLYQSSRTDLLHYFGAELISELDRMERDVVGGKSIPLPVTP